MHPPMISNIIVIALTVLPLLYVLALAVDGDHGFNISTLIGVFALFVVLPFLLITL